MLGSLFFFLHSLFTSTRWTLRRLVLPTEMRYVGMGIKCKHGVGAELQQCFLSSQSLSHFSRMTNPSSFTI
ncbi:hypothetical protein F4824DRAFT_451939 [Ustulina deusta]|nr:hypothetical protein F4824DRAFT_451939 [Ustulina deusta]